MTMLLTLTAALSLQTAPSYEACVAKVAEAPEAGRAYAESWQSEGGGNAAKHCAATAALAMDAPLSAGAMLMDLGKAEEQDPGTAARIYLQAAEAFMEGGNEDAAYAALRASYGLVPDAPEIHMTAAMIYATGGQWEGVVLTLMALEKYAPLSADALALRGRAHFHRKEWNKAAKDAVKALELDPNLVDALVLRGDLLVQGVALPGDPLGR